MPPLPPSAPGLFDRLRARLSAPAAQTGGWRSWLRALRPALLAIDRAERWRVVCGAGLGIALVTLISRAWAPGAGLPWLVAPIGASAVLAFALPASPLAQSWAVLGGNGVSALVGVACVHLLPGVAWAAPAAVALAIAAMLGARCLHPPGARSPCWR
jgi:CBS domain-containing membrane protein